MKNKFKLYIPQMAFNQQDFIALSFIIFSAGLLIFLTPYHVFDPQYMVIIIAFEIFLILGLQKRWRIFLLLHGFIFLSFLSVKFFFFFSDHFTLKEPVFVKSFQVIVEKIQITNKNKKRFILIPLETKKFPEKISVSYWGKIPQIKPGDQLKISAHLRPVSSPSSPLDFDYGRYLWFKGIGAVGYLTKTPEIIAKNKQKNFKIWIENKRLTVAKYLEKNLSNQSLGIALALVTGERSKLSEKIKSQFRMNGLSHVLAISGLHMTFAMGFCVILLRYLFSFFPKILLKYPVKKWACCVGMITGIAYVFLAGSPVSAIRAFFMSSFIFIAVIIDRQTITLRTVCLVAFGMLMAWPFLILNVSFQLSFAAVVGLIAFYQRQKKREKIFYEKPAVFKYIFYFYQIILTTIIATIATTPLIFYHFGNFPTYSILSNLLVLPIMGFVIMPFLFLSIIFSMTPIGEWCLFIVDYGLHFIIYIVDKIASFPFAEFYVRYLQNPAILMMALGGGIICFFQKNIHKLWGIILCAMGLIYSFSYTSPHFVVDKNLKDWMVQDQKGSYHVPWNRARYMTIKKWKKNLNAQLIKRRSSQKDFHLINSKNEKIAILYHQKALKKACKKAGMIISFDMNLKRSKCRNGKKILTAQLIKNANGMMGWVDKNQKIHLLTTRQSRGCQPWVLNC